MKNADAMPRWKSKRKPRVHVNPYQPELFDLPALKRPMPSAKKNLSGQQADDGDSARMLRFFHWSPPVKTVQAHILDWLEDKRRHHYSPRSVETFGYRIQRLALFLEAKSVTDLRLCDCALLQCFWNTLTADKRAFSKHSLGCECRAIKSFFAYLAVNGVVTTDPTTVLQEPTRNRRVRKQAQGEPKAVHQQVRQWQDDKRARNHSPKTLAVYSLQLKTFLLFLDERGIHDLRRVTPALMKDYYVALLQRKDPKPYTVANLRGKVRAVKSLFGFLTDSGVVIVNPADAVTEPKAEQLPRGILSVSEVVKVLEMPDLSRPEGVRDRAIFEVLYSTGIRLAEVTALTLGDLDLTGGVLAVREGKGGKDRVVPLGKVAVRFLNAYLIQARPLLLERCHGKPSECRLWLNRWGTPLAPGLIENLVRDYAIDSGIERPVSPHTFRHSAATHLLNHGANLRMVQELLGHARTSTTQRYTRVTLAEVKQTHTAKHPRQPESVEPFAKPVRKLYPA